MFPAPPDLTTAPSVVAAAAAQALAEVHDQIADLISAHSWADVVAQLREHAEDLSSSGIARNHLKARALEVAADDLAGGRAAFTDWPAFFSAELQPGPGERAEIRRLVGDYAAPVGIGASVAAAIEERLLRDGPDAFAAARRLPGRLANEIVLQATMWDDPRIMATPEARRLMRAGELGLRLRLEIIERNGHAAESPVRSANGVRRWLQALVVPWTPRPRPGRPSGSPAPGQAPS